MDKIKWIIYLMNLWSQDMDSGAGADTKSHPEIASVNIVSKVHYENMPM